jgi:hypothetical protein
MFIVWGKKAVTRRMGYVADFCPVCRGPKAFQLNRVGMASHVYYIPMGEGALIGHDRACNDCGVKLKADPRTYTSIPKKLSDVDSLRRQTYPRLLEVYAERLRIEDKVRNAPNELTAEERAALIKQPFALLTHVVQRRFSATHLDKECLFAMTGTAVAMLIAGPVTTAVAPEYAPSVLMTLLAAGSIATIWLIATGGRRYIKRKIIPVLSESLRPLQPTLSEINSVLAELRRVGQKLGKKLSAEDLLRTMRAM